MLSSMPKTYRVAPDFTLPDDKGEPVTLSSFRGKTVVPYFWPKGDTVDRAVSSRCDSAHGVPTDKWQECLNPAMARGRVLAAP